MALISSSKTGFFDFNLMKMCKYSFVIKSIKVIISYLLYSTIGFVREVISSFGNESRDFPFPISSSIGIVKLDTLLISS